MSTALILQLEAEMRGAALAMNWPAAAALRERFAIPAPVLARLTGSGGVGRANVTISRDGGRWEPGGPDWRLVLPVEEFGDLVDLCAISSADPMEWALRSEAGWCLGHDAFFEALTERRRRLRIFTAPFDWMRGLEPDEEGLKSTGICVLDWNAGIGWLRGLGERVQLEVDRGAGDRLRALLAHGGNPRVAEIGAGRMAA